MKIRTDDCGAELPEGISFVIHRKKRRCQDGSTSTYETKRYYLKKVVNGVEHYGGSFRTLDAARLAMPAFLLSLIEVQANG